MEAEQDFFTSIWKSITKFFNSLPNSADVIVLTLIKIILIVVAAKVVIVITNGIIRKMVKRRKRKNPNSLTARKSQSVATLMQSVIRYTVYFFAIATILEVIGLGITAGSILATAGIGGVALGLGAQGIIKDVLSGFFLLFENQFAVGDYVDIAGQTGTVEAITVRTTQIRAFTGELVILPNGSISKVINYTRGNIIVPLLIYIAIGQDTEAAIGILTDCVMEYAAKNREVVEPPEITGVNNIGEDGIELRAILHVMPMSQWKVERELKARIYGEFKKKGIESPYPKRVVIDNR
jgi:small-conductance mechanosensitive channel